MLRPLDFFSNPEYALITVTAAETRLYVGNNHQMELLEHWDTDAGPATLYLVGSRTRRTLQRQALHMLQLPRLARLPVVVVGEGSWLKDFMLAFDHAYGAIAHPLAGVEELTCPQLLAHASEFRARVVDIYLSHFQKRLKLLLRAGRVLSTEADILRAVEGDQVARMLWRQSPAAGSAGERILTQLRNTGVKAQLAPAALFPAGVEMLAILRGESHAHTPLFAMEA